MSAILAVTLALAGCGRGGLFDFEVTPEGRDARWPKLAPLGAFPIAPTADDPRIAEMGEVSDDLTERFANLKARSEALLETPVLTPEESAMLIGSQ